MINKAPLYSIVTVVYNNLSGLELTKASIYAQNFTDFEWIVVDGASDDGTVEFLEKSNLNNLHWKSEKDAGIYDAMNKGVSLCRGQFVVFLNAGDCFTDIEVISDISSFHLSPQGKFTDVLCCGANLVLADGRKTYRPPKSVDGYIWHGLPANHQATYYRRITLGENPYDLRFKMCGDYYVAANLFIKKAKFNYLNRPVVEFILDGVSFSWRKELFWEPYVIQQKLLGLGFGWRLLSLVKRTMSSMVLRLFSVPILGWGAYKFVSYVRSKQ